MGISEATKTGAAPALRPDRNFNTIACLGGDFGTTFAQLEGGAFAVLLDQDAAMAVLGLVEGGAEGATGVERDTSGWLSLKTLECGDSGVTVEPIRARIAAAKAADPDLLVLVDNSGVGPYLCRPLQMGADAVVEDLRCWAQGELAALTLAMGVGGPVCGGPAAGDGPAGCDRSCGDAAGTDSVDAIPWHLVAVRSPRVWESLRARAGIDSDWQEPQLDVCANAVLLGSLRSLSLRAQRRCDTALAVAHYLDVHPAVAWVRYPGLPEDPANDPARRTLEHGFGYDVVFGLVPDGGDMGSEGQAGGQGAGQAGGTPLDVWEERMVSEPGEDAPAKLTGYGMGDAPRFSGGVCEEGRDGAIGPEGKPRYRRALATTDCTCAWTWEDNGSSGNLDRELNGCPVHLEVGLEEPLDVVAWLEASIGSGCWRI